MPFKVHIWIEWVILIQPSFFCHKSENDVDNQFQSKVPKFVVRYLRHVRGF